MNRFENPGTRVLRDGELLLVSTDIRPARPEKGYLPAQYFDIRLADGTSVGRCSLRIGHNENSYYGGNISYAVFPPWRGRHYAVRACRLLSRLARGLGMEYLYISCDPDNRASARTCELAGGRLVETAALPPGNPLYAQGFRLARIYRIDL